MTIYNDRPAFTSGSELMISMFPKRVDIVPDDTIFDVGNKLGEVKREVDSVHLRQMILNLGRLIGSMQKVNALNKIYLPQAAGNLYTLLSQKLENVIPPLPAVPTIFGCVQDDGTACRLALVPPIYQGGVYDSPCSNASCPSWSGIDHRYLWLSPEVTLNNAGYAPTAPGDRFPLPPTLYLEAGPIEAGTTQFRNWIYSYSLGENQMFNGLSARTEYDGSNDNVIDFDFEHDFPGLVYEDYGRVGKDIAGDDTYFFFVNKRYAVFSAPTGPFTIGEILTGSTSGATATLFLNLTTNTYILVPISGVLVQGETITGGTSTETATLASISNLVKPNLPDKTINIKKEYLTVNTISGPFTQGETITGGTSGATAIFLLEFNATTFIVSHVSGTFEPTEVITGSLSTETASLTAVKPVQYFGVFTDGTNVEWRNITTYKFPSTMNLSTTSSGLKLYELPDGKITSVAITATQPVGTLYAALSATETVIGFNNAVATDTPGVMLLDNEEISFGRIYYDGTLNYYILEGVARGYNDTTPATHLINTMGYWLFEEEADFVINSQRNKITPVPNSSLAVNVSAISVQITYAIDALEVDVPLTFTHISAKIILPEFKIVYPSVTIADLISALYKDMFNHFIDELHVTRQEVCAIVANDSTLCCDIPQKTAFSLAVADTDGTTSLFIDMTKLGESAVKTVVIDWGDGTVYYSGKLKVITGQSVLPYDEYQIMYASYDAMPNEGMVLVEDELIGYTGLGYNLTEDLNTFLFLSRGKLGTKTQDHLPEVDVKFATTEQTLTVDKAYVPHTGPKRIKVTIQSLETGCIFKNTIQILLG